MKKKFVLRKKNLEFFFFEIKQITKPSLKKQSSKVNVPYITVKIFVNKIIQMILENELFTNFTK